MTHLNFSIMISLTKAFHGKINLQQNGPNSTNCKLFAFRLEKILPLYGCGRYRYRFIYLNLIKPAYPLSPLMHRNSIFTFLLPYLKIICLTYSIKVVLGDFVDLGNKVLGLLSMTLRQHLPKSKEHIFKRPAKIISLLGPQDRNRNRNAETELGGKH